MRRTRRATTPPTAAGREQSSGNQSCQKSEKQNAALLGAVSDAALLGAVSDAALLGAEKQNAAALPYAEKQNAALEYALSDAALSDTALSANNIEKDSPEPSLPNGSIDKDAKHTIAEVDVSLATDRKPRINPYVPSDRLDDKQERFVKEYQIDLNITQAAIRAGYDKAKASASGKRNMKQIKVLTAMAQERAKIMLRAEATADNVIAGLHAEAHYHGDGASHSARIAALNSLGKHFGMFVDLSLSKSEVSITIAREDSKL